MKLIVAGSRSIKDRELVCKWIRKLVGEGTFHPVVQILTGGAYGVDILAEQWAAVSGVKYKVFPADWDKHGKAAGPLRNSQMAQYGDALLAIWDGESKGTKDMINTAIATGLSPILIITVPAHA